MTLRDVATALRGEARATNERRLLVCHGAPEACREAAASALDAADVDPAETTVVGPEPVGDAEQLPQERAGDLLGATRDCVVFDAHEAFRPNALGRVVGAVDGGGLFVMLAPPLDEWPARTDGFDAGLAVPPFGVDDVTTGFRERVVATLRAHRGIAIVDVDAGVVEDDGLTHPAPRRRDDHSPTAPSDATFPAATYEACLTADQADAVAALDALGTAEEEAVVVEADRGRGKSSACGLAAGALAADGADVLVTAPRRRSAAPVFDRAGELAETLGVATSSEDGDLQVGPGSVRFREPTDAADVAGEADVLLVDEAAALPVRLLSAFLAADSVAFATTVHGYEGAGRGFSVRFRDRLADARHAVTDVSLSAPIRYAAGDPIEVWAFRALLLDAGPAVDQLVADADPGDLAYRELSPDDLLADEHLLREAFGLLVTAHYRTEPNDLARLLDAPNLTVRALCLDGHVVSVALLAREGGLSAATRAEMYEGGRVKGNMLPDVLTSQLRDEDAAVPVGRRVVRIATHHAVRSRGCGSRLLGEVRAEFADDLDWLGVGYGATPDLLRFWAANGYDAVHLSTTRNDTSGEYSVLMLDPLSEAGETLAGRQSAWFAERVAGVLSDPLDDADPDVVRATLRAAAEAPALDLSPAAWRTVADAAYGPGLFDMAPGAFRPLVVCHLIDPADPDALTDREERLLVRKVLQTHDWPAVAAELGYHSAGEAMRALGRALQPLVDQYGTDVAHAERERFRE